MLFSTWSCCLLLFHLLFFQSSDAIPKLKRYGDLSNDDAMIDNIDNIMKNEEWPKDAAENPQDTNYYKDDGYHLTPLKIQFAVPPSDLRYFYPRSVLREASLHSNIYGHDYLSLESRRALQGIWNKAYRASSSYDQKEPFYDQNGQAPRYGQTHGQTGQIKTQKSSDSNADNINYLQASPQHVEQLPFTVNRNPVNSMPGFYFIALVAGLTAVSVSAVVGAGFCYFRLHKNKRDAADAEYPAYGVTGPNKDLSPGATDRKLAQSAHMFHYQHQKQQMIALEKSSGDDRHCSASDVDSEEDGDEGDYTVYECPGLAPTGEMEVKNPLFSDDPTPASPHSKGAKNDDRDDDEEEEI